ncbi:MAG TPA: TolC family protein [Bacteriovoracaceae bacterium]|nr:TolC family protein [Bacteriovoracaceae bacterium]
MNIKPKVFLISGLLVTSVQAANLTLKDSFSAARTNMETLKRADALIEQRDEQKNRAKALMLPNISGVGSYTRIDQPDSFGNSPFTLTRQYSAGVRLSQPLFRGGSVSAYQLAKDNVLLAEFQKDATELNLYQLVINSYYNLSIAQMDLKNLEELQKFSKQRVKEIRGRTSIGRSRRGELIEAEAQLLAAESQFQQGQINLQETERTFEFYTQIKPVEIGPLNEVPKVSGSLEEYLLKLQERPDIQANQQHTRAADRQISIAKGGHLPSVDLTSNYYFDRTGILATAEWDVGVVVVVPIFQGGSVTAATREAVAVKRVAELNSSEALRSAQRDLRVNYQNYHQLQDQAKTLKEAVEKAGEAYRLNKKDYQYGIVTNLDVLQSLNVFIETRRSYNNVFALSHMTYRNLEALVGVLP